MTQRDNHPENVVNLADVRRTGTSGTKPRHIKKQEARAKKASDASANRVRTGRTKTQKANDRNEARRTQHQLDGSKRDAGPADAASTSDDA